MGNGAHEITVFWMKLREFRAFHWEHLHDLPRTDTGGHGLDRVWREAVLKIPIFFNPGGRRGYSRAGECTHIARYHREPSS